MSIRGKVAIELGVIAMLTTTFLLIFPRRNPLVDVGLAGFALLCIALSARYTKKVVWAASPPPIEENRVKRCFAVVAWVTVPPVLLFLLIGGIVAYKNGGWPAVADRVFNWRILAAFGFYFLWALMQQTLLQFYFLGRLLVLFPRTYRLVSMIITWTCFGLVHLPARWTALATVFSGCVCGFRYYRYRLR